MKIRNIAAIAAASFLAAVACNSVKPTTTIVGEAADGVETVHITFSDGRDTTIVAEDGQFKAEIPTDLTGFAVVESGDFASQIIADGTTLTIDFMSGSVVSNKPKRSLTQRFNDLTDYFGEFNSKYTEKMMGIYNDPELTDEQKDEQLQAGSEELLSELKDHLEGYIKKNKNNFVGVVAALQACQLAENDLEIQSYIDLLSEDMQKHPEVEMVAAAIAMRQGTSEGSMFTDFAVNSVVGFDEAGAPVTKAVCLSDYVGNGKYILVDFWASWCAPCRAEIPNIIDVYESFAGDRFDVLSIAVWDQPEDSFRAAEEEGIVWNQIVCSLEDRQIPTQTYGIEGIPQIILFGPDGRIVARDLRGESIAAKVAEVLGY